MSSQTTTFSPNFSARALDLDPDRRETYTLETGNSVWVYKRPVAIAQAMIPHPIKPIVDGVSIILFRTVDFTPFDKESTPRTSAKIKANMRLLVCISGNWESVFSTNA